MDDDPSIPPGFFTEGTDEGDRGPRQLMEKSSAVAAPEQSSSARWGANVDEGNPEVPEEQKWIEQCKLRKIKSKRSLTGVRRGLLVRLRNFQISPDDAKEDLEIAQTCTDEIVEILGELVAAYRVTHEHKERKKTITEMEEITEKWQN